MLHMLSYVYQGWWGVGGVLTFLTSSAFTLRIMLPLLKWRPMPMLHKKKRKVKKKVTLGLAAGHGVIKWPCCSLWPGRCVAKSGTKTSRREKIGWVDVFLRWLGWLKIMKIINFKSFFALEEQNQVTAQPKRIFSLELHTCQSKWMSILQTSFGKSHKYQHCVP